LPGVLEGEQRGLLRPLRLSRDRGGAHARRRAERLADVAGRLLTPQAVLFDNDGLLLDTEVLWTRAETDLFERHGRTFTIEHKRELIGTSGAASEAIIERHLGRPGDGRALMAELHAMVMEEALRGVEPMPGAVELLDALSVPVGVASNSPRSFVERTLEVSGLRE